MSPSIRGEALSPWPVLTLSTLVPCSTSLEGMPEGPAMPVITQTVTAVL